MKKTWRYFFAKHLKSKLTRNLNCLDRDNQIFLMVSFRGHAASVVVVGGHTLFHIVEVVEDELIFQLLEASKYL